jgi:hypothetical protein
MQVQEVLGMRTLGWLLLAGTTLSAQSPSPPAAEAAPAPSGQAPAAVVSPMKPVVTVSELMVQVVYPYSDAVFYITTRTPDNDAAWLELQAKTLALAESANLLMMPGRARDQDRWMKDAKLLLDVGTTAYRAAKRRDVEALTALNDELYASCVTCHQDYRPTYRRRLP